MATTKPVLRGQFLNTRLSFAVELFLLVLLTCSIFSFYLPILLAAQSPALITYQGKILNSNNFAVTTTVAMKLIIYNASLGGSVLYTAAGSISAPTDISVTPYVTEDQIKQLLKKREVFKYYLKTIFPLSILTFTFSPSEILPSRIAKASGSRSSFCRTRLSGRAP